MTFSCEDNNQAKYFYLQNPSKIEPKPVYIDYQLTKQE